MKTIQSRRRILRFLTLATAGMIIRPHAGRAGARLAATPDCADRDEPTPAQTAGPYFKPQSPQRTSLAEPGEAGTRLLLSGQVLSPDCQPVGSALLDFWQADASGAYDLEGFRHRGHLFTDENGRFELATIVPGPYAWRTRHIHVRVQPPHGSILTTQLYFPNEPHNAHDRLFMPALLMQTSAADESLRGKFNFVIGA